MFEKEQPTTTNLTKTSQEGSSALLRQHRSLNSIYNDEPSAATINTTNH